MAVVTLTRKGPSALTRRLKILVDGRMVASVRHRETVSFELAPGNHEMSVKMDWGSSAPLAVTAVADETLFVDAIVPNPIVFLGRMLVKPGRIFDLALVGDSG